MSEVQGAYLCVSARSAREPLLVANSPLRPTGNNAQVNSLYRKLASVTLTREDASAPSLPPLPSQRHHRERNDGSTRISSASGSVKGKSKHSPRQPLKALPALQEEQEDERRNYELAAQKARIVSQMAGSADDERRRNGREREKGRDEVQTGRGLLNEDTENIKPIREVKRPAKGPTGTYLGHSL